MITILGRPLWHDPPRVFSFGLDDNDTNKQIFDVYSFSHIQGGILSFFLLKKILNIRFKIAFILNIVGGIIFEIVENSNFVIKKFRKNYKKYKGDSIVNIIGDIACNTLGFLFAHYYPNSSIAFFIITSIILYPFGADFISQGISVL